MPGSSVRSIVAITVTLLIAGIFGGIVVFPASGVVGPLHSVAARARAAMVPPAPPSPVPAPTPSNQEYVALGDSLSAGTAALDYDPGTEPPPVGDGCRRSPHSFPRLTANMLNYPGVAHLACHGSVIDDIPTQMATSPALGPATRLVTVSTGINDLHFGDIILTCITSPTPCRPRYPNLDNDIRNLSGRLQNDYGLIRQHAVNARIIVVTYPNLLLAGSSGLTCPAIAGLFKSDVTWLIGETGLLDQTIVGAARAANVEVVDINALLRGNEICTSQPWANGITPSDRRASFHPNAAGHQAIAQVVTGRVLAGPA